MAHLQNVRDPARVLLALPFAAAGGAGVVCARHAPECPRHHRFIVLSGIALLGDMVLVSTMPRLATGVPLNQVLMDSCGERMRPVLMTSLVAALGFLPMALNTGFGAEVQRPLATVVTGGLVCSTALTLFLLPCAFLLLEQRRPQVGEPGRSLQGLSS